MCRPMPVAGYLVRTFKPWVMTSAAQFRAAPPPALTSETWTRDVNEIREIGGAQQHDAQSPSRPTIGKFWFLTGARTYNPIVRQVVLAKQMNLLDCARLYALASMAAADSFIAVFEAKYHFNFWRPVTAIRNADLSQNPATPRDATWQPLGETPMHPEYPCAHCISASAVAAVLRGVVGDEVGEITRHQHHGAGRDAPLDAALRLRRRSFERAHLGGIPLSLLDGGRARTWAGRSASSRSRRSCGRRKQ